MINVYPMAGRTVSATTNGQNESHLNNIKTTNGKNRICTHSKEKNRAFLTGERCWSSLASFFNNSRREDIVTCSDLKTDVSSVSSNEVFDFCMNVLITSSRFTYDSAIFPRNPPPSKYFCFRKATFSS